MTAVEKSPQALSYLRQNAARHGNRVTVAEGDVLVKPVQDAVYDLILSNPPYIPAGEIEGLMKEVSFEPRMALDGGEDGLLFYRAIVTHYPSLLCPGGMLAVEIGAKQGEQVRRLIRRGRIFPGCGGPGSGRTRPARERDLAGRKTDGPGLQFRPEYSIIEFVWIGIGFGGILPFWEPVTTAESPFFLLRNQKGRFYIGII